jgi:C-methyltransferase C-terminal domain/Putative zinc binding domain/Methyltransferase domain
MDSCRSCGSALTAPFLSLGNTPVSNAYLGPAQLLLMEPTYPLELYVCPDCFLVQIDEHTPAEQIFDDAYPYFSSFSETWLAHCQRYATAAKRRFSLNTESLVIEVASNDGYLLQYFHKDQIPVLGVEPARQVADAALAKGIPTEHAFFTAEWARSWRERGHRADLLIGNNVLAHVPPINDFVAGLALALAPEGVITMEFPHLLQLVQGMQFDTIYHEHFSYLSLHAVQTLFHRHGLDVFDVEELPTHGGSLRIYAQLSQTGVHSEGERVSQVREHEQSSGLLTAEYYARFGARVAETKRKILTFLIQAKSEGRRLAGYGAPAKGNTLLNYCGVGTDFIDFTVDKNPHKQGRYLPGSRIPILDPDQVQKQQPDDLLILPWNLTDEIVTQMASIRQWGGRFVVLIPEPRVIP